jgi:hypothetical protein
MIRMGKERESFVSVKIEDFVLDQTKKHLCQ